MGIARHVARRDGEHGRRFFRHQLVWDGPFVVVVGQRHQCRSQDAPLNLGVASKGSPAPKQERPVQLLNILMARNMFTSVSRHDTHMVLYIS